MAIQMHQIDQKRVDLWIYKLLLNSLSEGGIKILQEELEKRNRENEISSAIELRVLAYLTTKKGDIQYLVMLLDDWEMRTYGSSL